MMFLIRNLTEITIGNILPLPSQIGLGDDLTRILLYRNIFAHIEDAPISDTDFTKYWDDLTQVKIVYHVECNYFLNVYWEIVFIYSLI